MHSLWVQRKKEAAVVYEKQQLIRNADKRLPKYVRERQAQRIYGMRLDDMVEERFFRVQDFRELQAAAPPPRPSTPPVHEHKFRERDRNQELPEFRPNGHFSGREYVPRAVYRGGGLLRRSRTACFLGLGTKDKHKATKTLQHAPSATLSSESPGRGHSPSPLTFQLHRRGSKAVRAEEEEDDARFQGSELLTSPGFPPNSHPPPVEPLLPRRCTVANVDMAGMRGRLDRGPYSGPVYVLRQREPDKELGPFRTFVKVTYPFEPKDSRDKWHQQESHPAFRTEKSFKWKAGRFTRVIHPLDSMTQSVDGTDFGRSLLCSETYVISQDSENAKKDKQELEGFRSREREKELSGDFHTLVPSDKLVDPSTSARRRALQLPLPEASEGDEAMTVGTSHRTYKASLVYEEPSYAFQPGCPAWSAAGGPTSAGDTIIAPEADMDPEAAVTKLRFGEGTVGA